MTQPTNLEINSNLSVRGFISPQNIANYLGIKFAAYPERFRLSTLVPLDSHTGVLDATKYGPRCPQREDTGRSNRKHLWDGIAAPSNTIPTDEFECLNLNVYAPVNKTEGKGVPVFVWIHGGAWTWGDGAADYDGNYLVEKSIELGKPFIFVGINYRLGYYGFLGSKELENEAANVGEKYFTNKGMYDQRLALEWVQKYIHHFGGDASRVTIVGESAGGWSVLAHALSDAPLFQRGIAMSSPTFYLEDPPDSQAVFDKVVANLGVSASASDTDKLTALRKLSQDEIDEQMKTTIRGGNARPLWDKNWFVNQERGFMEDAPKFSDFVQGLAIGSTRDEAALFADFGTQQDAGKLKEDVLSRISDKSMAQEVRKVYGFDDAKTRKEVIDTTYAFTTEAYFGLLPIVLAEKHKTPPISVYRFDQADNFDKSLWKGYSYHALDTVFTCRLPNVGGPNAPKDMRATCDAMSTAIADFVYGKQWETFDKAGRVLVFDGENSGLKTWPKEQRWRQFVDTPERAKEFKLNGRFVIRYIASS